MNCIFCESSEIKERSIISGDLAWAFPTNIPIVPGHTLICPKRCVKRFEDLSRDEKEALEKLRINICQSLRKVFGAEGFNFAWNEGENCGQSVLHLHLHVLPRKKGDTGVYEYEPRKFLYRTGDRKSSPDEELIAVAKLIANGLS